MGTKGSSTQTSRVIVSIVGLIAIAAYGLTAALQILVWNPLGAPMYFFASFSAGMALADALFISGGDYTPWGGLLGLVSAAALVGTLMVMIFRGKSGMRTARS